jgi:hypothetical protein
LDELDELDELDGSTSIVSIGVAPMFSYLQNTYVLFSLGLGCENVCLLTEHPMNARYNFRLPKLYILLISFMTKANSKCCGVGKLLLLYNSWQKMFPQLQIFGFIIG